MRSEAGLEWERGPEPTAWLTPFLCFETRSSVALRLDDYWVPKPDFLLSFVLAGPIAACSVEASLIFSFLHPRGGWGPRANVIGRLILPPPPGCITVSCMRASRQRCAVFAPGMCGVGRQPGASRRSSLNRARGKKQLGGFEKNNNKLLGGSGIPQFTLSRDGLFFSASLKLLNLVLGTSYRRESVAIAWDS